MSVFSSPIRYVAVLRESAGRCKFSFFDELGDTMGFIAVGIGAALGAWLRWGLGMLLNQVHQHIPLGTLVANLAGGYVIGLAMAFFGTHNGISPEWRLFAITGFLGGLTTFSTFSAETVLMMQGRFCCVWRGLPATGFSQACRQENIVSVSVFAMKKS